MTWALTRRSITSNEPPDQAVEGEDGGSEGGRGWGKNINRRGRMSLMNKPPRLEFGACKRKDMNISGLLFLCDLDN